MKAVNQHLQLKLTRQEAEFIYYIQLENIAGMADAHIKLHEKGDREHRTATVVRAVLQQVIDQFEHKLYRTNSMSFTMKFNLAQVYTWQMFYFNYPIPSDQVWAWRLRQRIIDEMDEWLAAPEWVNETSQH